MNHALQLACLLMPLFVAWLGHEFGLWEYLFGRDSQPLTRSDLQPLKTAMGELEQAVASLARKVSYKPELTEEEKQSEADWWNANR